MKLSTKSRYSVRLLIDLALNGDKGAVLLKDISRRQEISEKYLGHLVPLLKSAGFIRTARGSKGGLTLIKDPKEISLWDIIEAAEGPTYLVECVRDPSVCKRANHCAASDFWGEITDGVMQVFKKYMLADLVQLQRAKNQIYAYSI